MKIFLKIAINENQKRNIESGAVAHSTTENEDLNQLIPYSLMIFPIWQFKIL